MFTGIVECLGTVSAVTEQPDALRLSIDSPQVLADTQVGDSIAVNGCCLTVVAHDGSTWTTDVMAETLVKTTIGSLHVGDRVNLERAATLATRLGGHIVQGHVDGVGTVVAREKSDNWHLVTIELAPGLAPFVVPKGSITIDGVSLTVVSIDQARIEVSLIPETLARTSLGWREPGDQVNLEVDVLAKYVERLLAARLELAQ